MNAGPRAGAMANTARTREFLITQEHVDGGRKIVRALPPHEESLSGIRLKRVVSRMIDGAHDEPVSSQTAAQSPHHLRRTAALRQL